MIPVRAYIAGAAIVALVAFSWAAYHHVERSGYNRAMAEIEASRVVIAEKAHAEESKLRDQLRKAEDARQEVSRDARETIADLQSRAAVGAVQLRCPATVTISATPEGGPIAIGSVENTQPAIVPAAAVDVLGLAGDIAEVVRQRNALVERFEACRAAANWQP